MLLCGRHSTPTPAGFASFVERVPLCSTQRSFIMVAQHVRLRLLRRQDIPSGLRLCRAAGWNQLASDWELFLECSPEGCHAAIDDSGEVVGTVTTIRYGRAFSWIAMVLVDPRRRREGIGTRL